MFDGEGDDVEDVGCVDGFVGVFGDCDGDV